MEVPEVNCMLIPPILKSEGDTNYLHKNASMHLNQGPDLDRPFMNMVDDAQTPKKAHQFYFVKFWPYEDPNVKSQMEVFEKLYEKINQEYSQITKKIEERMLDRDHHVNSRLNYLTYHDSSFQANLSRKAEKLDDLLKVLDRPNFAKNARRLGANNSCSLGKVNSQSLHFRMLHGSKSLATEKKLLREITAASGQQGTDGPTSTVEELNGIIDWFYSDMQCCCKNKVKDKQLFKEIEEIKKRRWTRVKDTASAAQEGKIRNLLDSREAIQAQVRLINKILEESRKEYLALRTKIKHVKKDFEKDLEPVEKDINYLRKQLADVDRRREEAKQCIRKQRGQHDEMNACYYGYHKLLSNAGKLAGKKDVTALEKLSRKKVENFMSKWNNSKAFRDDYEKRILPSLASRELSKDGRMRNPNKEPLIL